MERHVTDKKDFRRLIQSHEAFINGRSGTRIDMRFADLTDTSNENARLDKARMLACNFSYANFTNSSFREADVSNSMFIGSKLQRCDFTRANLAGARFFKADLREAILNGVDMRPGALSIRTTEGMVAKQFLPSLSKSHLESAQFINATLRTVQLRDANLTNANFQGADLRDADLSNSILTGADFTGARINGTRFEGVVFDLDERARSAFGHLEAFIAHLRVVKDTEAALDEHAEWVASHGRRGARADFSGRSLRGLDLRKRELSAVSFVGADLTSTDLRNASLAAANFSGARLHFTDLRGADLRGVNFDGCNALFADLRVTDCGPLTLAAGGELAPRFTGAAFEQSLFDGCNVPPAAIAQAALKNCLGLPPARPAAGKP